MLMSDLMEPLIFTPRVNRWLMFSLFSFQRGKFAVVRKCIKKDSGKEFAAKFMRKRRKGQDCRMEIIHEIAVLELAQDSPWVINLHEVYETPSEMILVLEYAAGGEIFDQCVADRDEAFKEEDVQRLMRQILEGVHFLHAHDVIHLDLKVKSVCFMGDLPFLLFMLNLAFINLGDVIFQPQNILLTSDSPLGDIKIVDFGLSRIMKDSEELREIMGTPEYVAPEVLSYEPISMATDMWSIGVLTYVMLTGISPFLGDNKQETFLNISQMNLSFSEEEFDVVSESAVDFIKTLLVKRPEDRATAEDCLKHPWLTQSCVHEPSSKEKDTSAEADGLQAGDSVPEINSEPQKPETEESIVLVNPACLCSVRCVHAPPVTCALHRARRTELSSQPGFPDIKVMPMVAPSPVCAGVLGQTVTGMVCDGSQPRHAGLRAPGAVPTPSAETEPAVRTIKLPCFLTKLAYLLFLGI
ncbi:Serine/threonine-protein kinase 17A-like protein [Camelus ferus]|nr:Serine/threonine-protein kinase 17A-like protein [Camelus ferus]